MSLQLTLRRRNTLNKTVSNCTQVLREHYLQEGTDNNEVFKKIPAHVEKFLNAAREFDAVIEELKTVKEIPLEKGSPTSGKSEMRGTD